LNYKQKILLTGSTGFIGQALLVELLAQSYNVVAGVRSSKLAPFPVTVKNITVGPLSATTDWSLAIRDINVVIHVAARAHILNVLDAEARSEFRKVNKEGTLNLAQQAVAAGVRRFIFISSIKVNGEATALGQSFTANDEYIPTEDPYGLSKFEAEQGLLELAEESGMEVVIIRLPLVYGPRVKANFATMMKWMSSGIPLPFGAIHNQRSLVAVENVVSFIIHCIDHPKAANEVFLVSDGEDISTTELLRKVAHAFGKKPLLLPVPVSLMKFAAKLLGKSDVANRLFGSLQVDSSKARDLLGWKPMITMDEQLKKTADAYLNEKTL
jgi:nucleoside-diphosphate-sugar epimerase